MTETDPTVNAPEGHVPPDPTAPVDRLRGYVVVIFGSVDDCADGLNFEPMEAIGPLTWDETSVVAAKYRDYKPHRLILREEP